MTDARPAALLLAIAFLASPWAGCLGPSEDRSLDPQTADADPSEGGLAAAYHVTPFVGGEPTIGATSNGTLWVVAHDRMLASTDGGQSWSESWKFAPQDDEAPASLVGDDNGVVTNHDPMMAVDPATDRVYFAGMWPALACSHLAWSDDGGESWTERGPACQIPEMDHQKLVTGPSPEDAPSVAGQAYPTVAYLCYGTANVRLHDDEYGTGAEASRAETKCGVSYDGGRTWSLRSVAAAATVDDCAGNIGPPDVGPEGTLALPVPGPFLCDSGWIAITQDTGLSWQLLEVPGGEALRGDDPMIRFGPEGTLWMAYTGFDNRTRVIGTPDLGETWHGPIDVTPTDVNSTVFNALGVGADGRLAVAYLGTNETDAWADHVDGDERWHLHIAAVEDASGEDPEVRHVQATPDGDPVQIGRICMSGATCEGSRNLLDFIGGTVAPDGTFYVSYTEGCVDACAGNPDAEPQDSRARRTAVAWIDGWPLER